MAELQQTPRLALSKSGQRSPPTATNVGYPGQAMLTLLRLPPRIERTGGGYRNVPYSPDELLRAATGALVALQPELKAEREARLQAEASLADERARLTKALQEREWFAAQAEASAGELFELQEQALRLEAEQELAREAVAQNEGVALAEAKRQEQQLLQALKTEAECGLLLEQRLKSQHDAASALLEALPVLDADGQLVPSGDASPSSEALSPLLEARHGCCSGLAGGAAATQFGVLGAGGEGGEGNEGPAGHDSLPSGTLACLVLCLRRARACSRQLESDAHVIEGLKEQLATESAKWTNAMESQLAEQVAHRAALEASKRALEEELAASRDKVERLEGSTRELQAGRQPTPRLRNRCNRCNRCNRRGARTRPRSGQTGTLGHAASQPHCAALLPPSANRRLPSVRRVVLPSPPLAPPVAACHLPPHHLLHPLSRGLPRVAHHALSSPLTLRRSRRTTLRTAPRAPHPTSHLVPRIACAPSAASPAPRRYIRSINVPYVPYPPLDVATLHTFHTQRPPLDVACVHTRRKSSPRRGSMPRSVSRHSRRRSPRDRPQTRPPPTPPRACLPRRRATSSRIRRSKRRRNRSLPSRRRRRRRSRSCSRSRRTR